jgi:hypothetical protein
MTDDRRTFTAGGGFFFERPQDVQQGDGFRKCSTPSYALPSEIPRGGGGGGGIGRFQLWNLQ